MPKTMLKWFCRRSRRSDPASTRYAMTLGLNGKVGGEYYARITGYGTGKYNYAAYPTDDEIDFIQGYTTSLKEAKSIVKKHLESYNFKFVTKRLSILL